MTNLIERLDSAGPDDANLFELCMDAYDEIERIKKLLEETIDVEIDQADEIERLTDRNEEVEREIEVFIAINKRLRVALDIAAEALKDE